MSFSERYHRFLWIQWEKGQIRRGIFGMDVMFTFQIFNTQHSITKGQVDLLFLNPAICLIKKVPQCRTFLSSIDHGLTITAHVVGQFLFAAVETEYVKNNIIITSVNCIAISVFREFKFVVLKRKLLQELFHLY